ncbi:hypothetical protein EJ07DRAFT_159098 [Lizonia empirigonia]|nr:hypothetical protein EJ07DRAFT_159098 [Lizonia empirigonia]
MAETPPGSKTDANGNARLDPHGFYNDEEAWIHIYYTLLSKKASRDADFRIPPTIDILLHFNAYFQGFKEPVGSWRRSAQNDRILVMECAAVPKRDRRTYKEFEAAVQRICPTLKAEIDSMRVSRSHDTDDTGAQPEADYGLAITPEVIHSVLDEHGNLDATALANLSIPAVWHPSQEPWQDRALVRIDARVVPEKDAFPLWHRDFEPNHWNPLDLPARSLANGPQMVSRFDDAAGANAILNACPVPPRGYFGDLNTLKDEDFKEDVYATAQEKADERVKHEDMVRLLARSRNVEIARGLLIDWKWEYGAVGEASWLTRVVGAIERNEVEKVEKEYEKAASALLDEEKEEEEEEEESEKEVEKRRKKGEAVKKKMKEMEKKGKGKKGTKKADLKRKTRG